MAASLTLKNRFGNVPFVAESWMTRLTPLSRSVGI